MNALTRFNLRRFAQALFIACAVFALPAWAEDCSEFPNGVVDGDVLAVAPSQIQIDRHCTIRNWPASKPLSTNFSFLTQPGQTNQRWIVVFDNVVHTGQMACNAVAGHKIWFTNGSSTSIQEGCQNLLIPVEKIDKANPAGQTTATVGVPFTYTLTMPVLFDSATGVVINFAGSLNDLHGVTVIDNLNETGADLRYISHQAFWQSTGIAVAHTFDNVGGVLTFDNFPIIPAGEQIVLEMTVMLEDSPTNVIGNQFVNTAKWDFGRLIDGEFFEPLPGEWGISPPLTIAGPDLNVTKTGPAELNLGVAGDFVIDVANAGLSAAWDVTLLDVLPDDANGGMCERSPQITSAQVFAADGVTPVPGKAPLTESSDFNANFDAGTCQFALDFTSAQAVVSAGERLVVRYQAWLDNDTQDGISLTNVAGVTSWFNGDASNPERQQYTRSLSDGTPGNVDHEDNHTVSAALTGIYFEKSVENLTTDTNPTTSAVPGEMLRYTLRVRTTDSAFPNFRITDDLGALNPVPVFAPGTLTWVAASLPPGADTTNTDANAGTNNAGLLDIRGLNLPPDSEVSVQFDIELLPALNNGTVVTNQASVNNATQSLVSDDPNVNGIAFPDIVGDEDPTVVRVVSEPYFDIDKVSTYLEGDPTILLAGEALRYTISVRNTGSANATAASLRDQIPGNTSYIVGTTRLNGVVQADINGASVLEQGLSISTPSDPTPGFVPADAAAGNDTVATVTFDVRVLSDLIDGTMISNQAFLDDADAAIINRPSDDPRTAAPDDPTRDIVGNVPLIFAEKSAALIVDNNSPGIVDPGDTLRYTINVYNNSATPATEVSLQDGVPGNTAYVAGSTMLNGEVVTDVNGAFPLQPGLPISTVDLTPPLPQGTEGVLTPGTSATVQFDVVVDAGTPSGTLITNQAQVISAEAQPVLTDGDGDPTTGPEPTIVVVGDAQLLRITKQVAVVGGGAAEAGDTLEYLVRISNPAPVPAYGVYIFDDLDDPVVGQLTFVPDSAYLNGETNGLTIAGNVLTADYDAAYGPLPPGGEIQIRFQAVIDSSLPIGTNILNRAVVTWNTDQTATAEAGIDVGGVVGSGTVSGFAWHDANFDNVMDLSERPLENWIVQLLRNDTPIGSAVTAADGSYSLRGIQPNYLTTDVYRIDFSAPGAGPDTAKLGLAYSGDFVNGLQEIDQIEIRSGSNLIDLHMPIDPNGTVYNTLTRGPLSGVTLTLLDTANSALPASCFDDPNQQGQVTPGSGYYKFSLNFSSPACAAGGQFRIAIGSPNDTFVTGFSELIPPASSASAPLNVPACPLSAQDAIPATDEFCEVHSDTTVPGQAVPFTSPALAYHAHFVFDASDVPGSSQVFNNHLPVDPVLTGVVTVSKTTPMVDVQRGQLIPYTITVGNTYEIDLLGVDVIDRFPPGFHYVEGSARIDGVYVEPERSSAELIWRGLTLDAEGSHRIELLLGVGAGVSEGEYVNRAYAADTTAGQVLSGQGTATVRLVPDPTFDCTDVTGKVFDDQNRNGLQDAGELGITNAQIVTARGLTATTDAHGRFHITCAIVPNEQRGSNFVLKLNDGSLPSGFRASTRAVQVKRATRGKTLDFSFGASIHRVVGLDIADPVFEPDSAAIRPQWQTRFPLLIEELQKSPALLRLSYLADNESEKLVHRRLRSLRQRIEDEWRALNCCYTLDIETQVFWRLGGPAVEKVRRVRKEGRQR